MLKPGGMLYMFDVVFSFAIQDFESAMNGWVGQMREKGDPEMAEETIIHIRDEFSTFDWIMNGMISRSGSNIVGKFSDFPNCLTHMCLR